MSWFVGSICRNANENNLDNISGAQMWGVIGSAFGDSRNRHVWFDTSHFYNESNVPISIQYNADCKTFDVTTDRPIQYVSTTTPCQAYVPGAP
jgi:hypothetical protein